MRSDMDKVIVETSRRGLRQTRKALRSPPLEHFPQKMGMKRPHVERGWRRGNDDHLAPLRRFLLSRCGQPWDQVWSEICAVTDARSTVQHHVRIHVPDFVAIKTRRDEDGRIWVNDGGFRFPVTLEDTRHDAFVDPGDGVLRANIYRRPWFRRQRERDKAAQVELAERMREQSRYVQLHKFGDTGWWEVRLARIASEAEHYRFRQVRIVWGFGAFPPEDVVHKSGLTNLGRVQLYGRTGVYAIAKRQLSKRDAKKRGLPL